MIFTNLLVLAACLLAAPASAVPASAAAQSNTGEITYFHPSVGLGACGTLHQDTEYVVALSAGLFDLQTPNGNPNNNPLCGKKIKVSHNGKSVTVKVTDRCPGTECAQYDLDLSPSAFQVLEPLATGRFVATWDWA